MDGTIWLTFSDPQIGKARKRLTESALPGPLQGSAEAGWHYPPEDRQSDPVPIRN